MATIAQPQTGAKPAAGLSNEEILRYSRHLIMPEGGMEGPLKLKKAKGLLIGTAGPGAPPSLYLAAAGAGYRCFYPDPPPPGLVPSCAEGGVLGVLPGIVGSIQAMETIKLILGRGDNLIGRLLLFDALGMKFRELKLRKNPNCPVCGTHPTITKLIDYYEFCGVRGEEAPGPTVQVPEITPRELKVRLDRGDDLFILDVREPHEYQICNLKGHLLPLGELTRRVHELDSSREIVAHCRSGKRDRKSVV